MLLASLLTLACAQDAVGAGSAAQVTVYRCTSPGGRLTLRDSPCIAGEHQQVRAMLRPTDPPRAAVSAIPPTRRRVDSPSRDRVVYVTPPRTSYECVTPDGARYSSESPEGNPRWVPLWTLGYPVAAYPTLPGPVVQEGGFGGRVDYRSGNTRITVGGGRRFQTPGGYGGTYGGYGNGYDGPPVVYAPAGTWIRDTCNPIPAAEACDQLRDRRDALDVRYTSALQSERDAIVREERGIDARLGSDCR